MHTTALQLFRNVLSVLVVLVGIVTNATAAELRLPSIFADHAVLQQKAPIAVWGWGEPGETVTAAIAGQKATAVVGEDSRWATQLAPMDAGGPHELVVTTASGSIALTDILIGEVWLASGQSNMQWSIKLTDNWEEELARSDNDAIRFAMTFRETSTVPLDDLRGLTPWATCNAESLAGCYNGAGFSAVSYYFAKYLQESLGVPVGIINTSWGGTRIEPWTPPVGFSQVPALSDISAQIKMNTPDSAEYQATLRKAIGDIELWLPGAREALENGAFPPTLPAVASQSVLSSRQSPTALYNAMVHPLVPYSNRGFIWYQGESNRGEGMLYRDKMEALIRGWRSVWQQDELACYFVQLAPYDYGNGPQQLPEIWEAQTATLALPNTGMAVINDIGNVKDIHPRNKDDVGKRLALLALNKTYGKKEIVADSPLFDRFEVADGEMRVHFNHAKTLKTRDGKAPDHFTICGPDGVFHPATASIKGATVLLRADGVNEPVAVRFAWDHRAEPNLTNEAGLPASAFRAGTAPRDGALRQFVPEAEGMKLVYAFDPTNCKALGGRVEYDEDNHTSLAGKPIDRVAYFMHLAGPDDKVRWVYLEMDPFTQDLSHIGVPIPEKDAWFQTDVKNLFVRSSDESLPSGNLTGGAIEFWACNYATQGGRKLPGAKEDKYDFDDTMHPESNPGYGSMQIHDVTSGTTLMAFNNPRSGRTADIGIGNSPSGSPDWTFTKSAGKWTSGTMLVLVRTRSE
jgi:sialate O-acetylesterase